MALLRSALQLRARFCSTLSVAQSSKVIHPFRQNPVVDVETLQGEKVGQMFLHKDVFAVPLRPDLLHQTVVWQLAKRRAGTASTKERSEVAGSNRKLYQQKGTGRARVGDKKAGHRRGGGTTHGPRPRDFSFDLNKQVRYLALCTALSTKLAQNELLVVDSLASACPTGKVKEFLPILESRAWHSVLMVDTEFDSNFLRAINNVQHVQPLLTTGANVYDILRRRSLVMTRDAVESLTNRLLVGRKLGGATPEPVPYST